MCLCSRGSRPHLSADVRRRVLRLIRTSAQTVAAVEGADHGGGGEDQQQDPDAHTLQGRLIEGLDAVPPPQVDHAEVAVQGQQDEEDDAGAAVQEQHEEHGLADGVGLAPPQVVLEIVNLDGQTDHQQEVSNHNVEEEDALVPPEFESVRERQQTHQDPSTWMIW